MWLKVNTCRWTLWKKEFLKKSNRTLSYNLKIFNGRKNSLWCWRSPQDKDETVYLVAAVCWGSRRKTANFLRNCGGDWSTNVKQILFTECLSLFMCYNKILSTGWCVSHRSLFLTILEAWKSQDRGASKFGVWWSPLPGSQQYFCCVLILQKGWGSCLGVSFIRASWLTNSFSSTLPPNIITLEIRTST